MRNTFVAALRLAIAVRMRFGAIVGGGVVCWLASTLVPAQVSPDENLQTCLSGKYPRLCVHERLTPEQLSQVRTAELRENLQTCFTGKYSALCDHSMLSPEQAAQVRAAERAENLRRCSSGRYPSLCQHELLSSTDVEVVRAAELSENLRVCSSGRYPTLCNHALLSPEQAKGVAEAERVTKPARSQASSPNGAPPSRLGNCESGHWIDAVEGDGRVLRLEDGSLWKVSDIDTVTTAIWLPISDVIVCDGKIINVDDGESVEATPITPIASHGGAGAAPSGYAIEAVANDETFVINGEVFKAQTYCFGFEKGDRVKFLSGSALGACATATILHFGTGKTCKLWCE